MSQPNTNALFERSITLPDSDARDRLARLVGMDRATPVRPAL